MQGQNSKGIGRARTISRLIGAVLGVVFGVVYGSYVITNSSGVLTQNRTIALVAILGSAVTGAASLALAAPLLSVEPYLWLQRTLDEAPISQVVAATAGLVVALTIAALLAALLSPLPWGLGYLISLSLACALVYAGVRTGTRRREALLELFHRGEHRPRAAQSDAAAAGAQSVLVDTSSLVDGRMVDVAAAGFFPTPLLVPDFVLEELQRLADSGDSMRRAKGRRGLGVVESLQAMPEVRCEAITAHDSSSADVDVRLVKLAHSLPAAILTEDYNLNRLARIEGVRVLNLNELANALKPIVAAGETMSVAIVKEGKEPHQGVGYLEDGTMVVVEGGRNHQSETVTAIVTSVLQTAAGRMIFAAMEIPDEGRPRTLRLSRAAKVAQR